MRILRIDTNLLDDPRFISLSTKLGTSLAIGEYIRAVILISKRSRRYVPKNVWDEHSLSDELFKSKIFVADEDEVHFVPPSYCGIQGLSPRRLNPDDLAKLWNDNCGTLVKVKELSGQRRARAKQRLSECDDNEVWLSVIRWLAQSPWHTGRNDRGWKANFDFMLKPDTRVRIIERIDQSAKAIALEDI